MKEIVCKYVGEGQHAHTHARTHTIHTALSPTPCSVTVYTHLIFRDMQTNHGPQYLCVHTQTEGGERQGRLHKCTYVRTHSLQIYELFQCYCETACPISLPWPTQMMHTMHVSPVNTHTSLHLHTYVRTIRRSSLEMKPSLSTSYTRKTTAVISGCRVQNTGCKVQSAGCRV